MIEAGMGVGTNKHEINDEVVTEVLVMIKSFSRACEKWMAFHYRGRTANHKNLVIEFSFSIRRTNEVNISFIFINS